MKLTPGTIRVSMAGDSEWGDQFLSPAWGENAETRQSLGNIAACAASDLMFKATELRHERVTILRPLIGRFVHERPESPSDAMQELDTLIVTHGIVLAMAQALLRIPPERREEWLDFLRTSATNAFAIAAATLEESAEGV